MSARASSAVLINEITLQDWRGINNPTIPENHPGDKSWTTNPPVVSMVFNLDKPKTKDFTETVRLLANLSRFVIVDITNPRPTPLELQATVPDYMIPFAPILEREQAPFAMFVDLQKKIRLGATCDSLSLSRPPDRGAGRRDYWAGPGEVPECVPRWQKRQLYGSISQSQSSPDMRFTPDLEVVKVAPPGGYLTGY
jgi:hypothetical protein